MIKEVTHFLRFFYPSLPLITRHFTKKAYGVTSPFGRSPLPLNGRHHLWTAPIYNIFEINLHFSSEAGDRFNFLTYSHHAVGIAQTIFLFGHLVHELWSLFIYHINAYKPPLLIKPPLLPNSNKPPLFLHKSPLIGAFWGF